MVGGGGVTGLARGMDPKAGGGYEDPADVSELNAQRILQQANSLFS